MKKSVIVNMNIEYIVEADTENEAILKVQNDIELPHGYQEDTFQIEKVGNICSECGYFYEPVNGNTDIRCQNCGNHQNNI